MADEFLPLAAQIAAAYLNGAAATGAVKPGDLPAIIRDIYATLKQPETLPSATEQAEKPALPTKREIAKSITPDALISFVDGKGYKTLKRHLSTHGLTVEGYKERYGLPSDYPSVAPNYSAARSAMAKSLGLGRKAAPPAAAPKSRAKRGAAAA